MFTLSSVVPWGRSFDEYVRMFALTEGDLASSILGCGDGPASFNAEATRRGTRVVSCDPLYQFDAAPIRQRIDETATEVLAQAHAEAVVVPVAGRAGALAGARRAIDEYVDTGISQRNRDCVHGDGARAPIARTITST